MSMSEADGRKLGFATRCIHSGAAVDPETRAIKRPIVLGNSFKLADTMAELPDAFNWDIPRSLGGATPLSSTGRPRTRRCSGDRRSRAFQRRVVLT